MVLFRESYVYFARFACVLADQLLFEVADEGMGTDRQIGSQDSGLTSAGAADTSP